MSYWSISMDILEEGSAENTAMSAVVQALTAMEAVEKFLELDVTMWGSEAVDVKPRDLFALACGKAGEYTFLVDDEEVSYTVSDVSVRFLCSGEIYRKDNEFKLFDGTKPGLDEGWEKIHISKVPAVLQLKLVNLEEERWGL
jgi:hypothetical protein